MRFFKKRKIPASGEIIQLNPGEQYIELIKLKQSDWIQIVPVNWTDAEKIRLYISLRAYAHYLDEDYFISPYVGAKEAEA